METQTNILQTAKKAIQNEGNAILALQKHLSNDFVQAVQLILNTSGRLVVTGVGKSAIVAQKIVATLNSTGTPALFMHAADAIHGDLGMLQKYEHVLCLSQSGNTDEIKSLIPLLKNSNRKIIALTGNPKSFLATHADLTLLSTIESEACPLNLAPTTSTTAQMVIGDALAICLLEARQFSTQDFASLHPGGMLGKKLLLTVKDIAQKNPKPSVYTNDPMRKVVVEMTSNRLGATAVLDPDDQTLVGIITDGDLRRLLEQNDSIQTLVAQQMMTQNPKTIDENQLATHAVHLMQQHNISQLIATNANSEFVGFVHLHDLIAEGVV